MGLHTVDGSIRICCGAERKGGKTGLERKRWGDGKGKESGGDAETRAASNGGVAAELWQRFFIASKLQRSSPGRRPRRLGLPHPQSCSILASQRHSLLAPAFSCYFRPQTVVGFLPFPRSLQHSLALRAFGCSSFGGFQPPEGYFPILQILRIF